MEEKRRIRILLVEDHPVVRLGLRTAISAQPDMEVINEADSPESAMSKCFDETPDLAIIPLRLGGEIRGIELCREIKTCPGAPYVLIYTFYNSREETSSSYLSGADSYLHKGEDTWHLLDAIRATSAGRKVWLLGTEASEQAAKLEEAVENSGLTRREREVLGFMLQRFTNAQIAKELFIELPTVKTHVSNILHKLGLSNRQELF